ncbi:helix-turn-helix transcriptional regulator [Thiovibrio frasassiensis]|uniref:WYL domain-containing protein n=1 Tax=Thiovibrio frasassiensis TaxID=2984131 RepID=A0A9X4MCQ0_9BACT|nr:WYL domain-containing protein [Thiovibrio frasassiensis]MDG4475036.1 WYL domain-containing protein [Thiovibrio frasassiensis]
MARDKTQLLRLLFIDRKIREGMRSGIMANCSSMAAEYEVSAKSILRDIDYLRSQRDAPIAYDAKKRGYYYTEENYALPALSLNESDLFAICIAEKALRMHEDTPIYRKLQKVFRKIEESLPEKVSIHPAWVEDKLSVVPEQQTRLQPEVWETVSAGLNTNQTLNIAYRKPGGQASSQRRVDPYHLVRYQGEWYLIGYCHRRHAIVTFAMSRIETALLLAKKFSVPEDFDHARYGGSQFGIFSGEREVLVKVWFAKEHAPYVLEREWHPQQSLVRKKDGGVEISFPAHHLYEVKRWVLSWGSGAKVLAPQELVDSVQQELASALADYDRAQRRVTA